MNNNCLFCEKKRFSLNKSIELAGEESIIYEDENVFITPDIAPLLQGHFLIVTKKHWNSFGNTDNDTYVSIEKAKEFISKKILYNDIVLFFEHGTVKKNMGGSSIDHAHLHAVPKIPQINLDTIDSYVKESRLVSHDKIMANQKLLKQLFYKKQSYIYYEITHEKWVYPVGFLPSQFLRMMFAPYMSFSYDWKTSYNTDESKKLFLQTLAYAKNNLKK
jgi:diadenosine tetraphosphate (Ap4A) HIT family hydrolase